jgi:primosomal protein N' (replication factor Y) (superfamily II helicase)
MIIADVLIPLALDKTYSYAVPQNMHLKEGDAVRVLLGKKEVLGIVWSFSHEARPDLKPVIGKAEAPHFSHAFRQFLDKVAWYTLAPRGLVLAMALKSADDARPHMIRLGVRLKGPPPQRLTDARLRVLKAAEGGLIHAKRSLADAAGVSLAVIDGLIDEGTLEALPLYSEAPPPPDPAYHQPLLSPDQEVAAEALKASLRADKASVTLLEGVTGSGKTEVYFEAVAEALRQGRQALILMPEIALTGQFTDRFSDRFGVKPALWHSGITGRKREKLYEALASGEARVVAGARSALFLPYQNLGAIIVDEEHESAYKQEDGVLYHARDMAVLRGSIEKAHVILASATPSLESRVNAARGRYQHLVLLERFGGRSLPAISTIDLRSSALNPSQWLSAPLVEAMQETLAAKQQILLFLNRRGYAPLTLCRSCGHRYECKNCTAWLVEHRFRRALVCHHCGHAEPIPQACGACGAVDALTACGPGVERIAEEVSKLFPEQRVLVLSSDFPGGIERLRREMLDIAEGRYDIIIGTQLVAKGHNFPLLTLVGVIDADIGLTSGDPRASERTFQVLQQVTGRAGRGTDKGRALLQSYQPDHPVLQALTDYNIEQFYHEQSVMREQAKLPPFGRLAAIIISGKDKNEADHYARTLARAAEPPRGFQVLGPAEAPLFMIRGRYRYRLLIKSERGQDLQAFLRDWIARTAKPRGSVKVAIDIDPYNFM